MILLRRRHRLDPLEVTTSPAPILADGHVDVCADAGASPQASPARTRPPLVEVDLPAADAPLEFVDDRPAVDRGRCYHHLHFEYDGRRFGALVHEHQAFGVAAAVPVCREGGPVTRRVVTAAVLALMLAAAAPAWADDSTPSPSPTATASDSPDSPEPSASPTDNEQPTASSDPREGTWDCSSDGSSCELVRDCQQEAFAQGFDPADYCSTPTPEEQPTSDDATAGDVAEFPYTPDELDALPDDSPLLTDGDWLAVES